MDARMKQLIQALSSQRKGGAIGASGGVRSLPGLSNGLTSPQGVGGWFSSPISFNPFQAQQAMGFQGLVGPSQPDNSQAAATSGAGPVGTTSTSGVPDPGLGASDAGVGSAVDNSAPPAPLGAAANALPSTGFFQSDPGAPPTPSFIGGGQGAGTGGFVSPVSSPYKSLILNKLLNGGSKLAGLWG